ncbi:hypothetical protein CCR96_18705 [Halochromatium roseum]|nr:hypothetical protein [Halochromatium roseum]
MLFEMGFAFEQPQGEREQPERVAFQEQQQGLDQQIGVDQGAIQIHAQRARLQGRHAFASPCRCRRVPVSSSQPGCRSLLMAV